MIDQPFKNCKALMRHCCVTQSSSSSTDQDLIVWWLVQSSTSIIKLCGTVHSTPLTPLKVSHTLTQCRHIINDHGLSGNLIFFCCGCAGWESSYSRTSSRSSTCNSITEIRPGGLTTHLGQQNCANHFFES